MYAFNRHLLDLCMDYIIWHSKADNEFKLDKQVNRDVFECDRTEYLRVLHRFTRAQAEEAKRIYSKLQNASKGFT